MSISEGLIKSDINISKNNMPITLFGNNVNNYIFAVDEEQRQAISSELLAQSRRENVEATTPAPRRNANNPWFWIVLLLIGLWLVTNLPSCSPLTTRHSSLESQVRTWASDYPADLRNRWAWCYLDSVANFSTEQKLREDVRLKSVQVLTDADREVLSPLDRKISDAVPKQKTELVETYHAIGNGLKVAEWLPPPDGGVRRQESGDRSEPPPDPKPPPPDRRRIFRR